MRLVCLVFLVAAGAAGCDSKIRPTYPPQLSESRTAQVTNYANLLTRLRATGSTAEPGEDAGQPFFSVMGKIIKVDGEDVQVFEYSDAASANAQAAEVSPTGAGIGSRKIHWIGPPHFYKEGRLLVLYIGNNDKVLNALDSVLGPQFAGSARTQ